MTKQWAPRAELQHSLGAMHASVYHSARVERESSRRSRHLAATPAIVHLSEWDGNLGRRRIRIRDRRLDIEMFATPSVTKRLYVFLSAGGGPLKDGERPNFPRSSWHTWLDGICLNIDDPTFFSFPGKLQTGWYLGDRQQDAVGSIVEVIRKVQEHYGVGDRDVYVFGSSAGGTSALKLGKGLPGATVIAENPPLYPHESSSVKYLRRIDIDLEDDEYRARNDLEHVFDHSGARYFIIQNAEDEVVMRQLTRLLAANDLPEPRIGLNQSGALNVYMTSVPSVSPHHVFCSVQEFQSVLRSMDHEVSPASRATILDAVHESLRARCLNEDRISNLKGWAKLFDSLDIPLLADLPLPTDAGLVRVALRSRSQVVYRMRLARQAKSVFIAVNANVRDIQLSRKEVEQVAESLGAKAVGRDDDLRLSLSGVPLAEAPERLGKFVEATARIFERMN